MAKLRDWAEVEVGPDYRTFGIVDEACAQETHTPDAPEGSWLRAARGMVYLECPGDVITVRLRLEAWSGPPPAAGQWSGTGEAEVELPSGVLCVDMLTAGWEEAVFTLPKPGHYRVRMLWAFNPEAGPFHSSLTGATALDTPPGREEQLAGVDQFCLAQFWRPPSLAG
ncbi:hypothetical protein [Streptomyces sp. NBC_00859]|uniref:hypothetical protein n=1 Tax=Streptomyces sp. NBC_00859 TaxID=2903682 RepID=UPI00386E1244|nr:hypothetical protein OG584_21360 [Streptomyces sp. NBC_00859]